LGDEEETFRLSLGFRPWVFQLNLLAYPDSADANDNLGAAYFANGQKELARQYEERALTLLDSHKSPASSWSDTEQRRAEIRRSIEETLKKLGGGSG
jgi:Tfp pilus assembly protein PilF